MRGGSKGKRKYLFIYHPSDSDNSKTENCKNKIRMIREKKLRKRKEIEGEKRNITYVTSIKVFCHSNCIITSKMLEYKLNKNDINNDCSSCSRQKCELLCQKIYVAILMMIFIDEL
jgi:hypothetical protein